MIAKQLGVIAFHLSEINYYLQIRKRPYILVVDGPDGVGKTTLCNDLNNLFQSANIQNVLTLRQPFLPEIRKLVIHEKTLTARERCYLLLLDTVHVTNIINEAKNSLIILDRSIYTSMPVYNFDIMSLKDVKDVVEIIESSALRLYFPDIVFRIGNKPFVSDDTYIANVQDQSKIRDLFNSVTADEWLRLRKKEESILRVLDIIDIDLGPDLDKKLEIYQYILWCVIVGLKN